MGHIIADEEMEMRLYGILEPIEIRDRSGKVLGHYNPVVTPEEWALYEKARTLFDPEEMKRRKEQERGKGKTTAEVFEHLRSLENQACDTR